jgi:hypothetical protein
VPPMTPGHGALRWHGHAEDVVTLAVPAGADLEVAHHGLGASTVGCRSQLRTDVVGPAHGKHPRRQVTGASASRATRGTGVAVLVRRRSTTRVCGRGLGGDIVSRSPSVYEGFAGESAARIC